MPSLVRLLSAVVVNYLSAPLAARCVASLRRASFGAGIPLEIVIVDNSALPEERHLLGALDGVRYLPLDRNAGYAGGLARGVAETTGDILLLANPDLLFDRGSLAPLLEALGQTNAGAAGPRFTWDEEGRWLLPPLWIPSPRREVAKIVSLSRLGLRFPLLREWHALALPQWEASRTMAVPGLVGALLAVPRPVWERVGPFDERFALFFEDTDWSVRASRSGWKLLLVPESRVVHYHGQSTGRAREHSVASGIDSERRFFGRHFSPVARALRRTAAALLPPASVPGLPERRPPFRLEWSREGRVLVELTTAPEGAPAAGRFVDGTSFELAGQDWDRLPYGFLYLRATERPTGRIVAETAFCKSGPAGPGQETPED